MRALTADEIKRAYAAHRETAAAYEKPDEVLGEHDRQRKSVLAKQALPLPCPACREAAPPFLAKVAFYAEEDRFDPTPPRETFDGRQNQRHACPHCGRQLVYCVGRMGGQWWELKPSAEG